MFSPLKFVNKRIVGGFKHIYFAIVDYLFVDFLRSYCKKHFRGMGLKSGGGLWMWDYLFTFVLL